MFAEQIKEDLYNCLKCAMCQPVCPTYKVTRMERHAPRGRIQMVKHYLEGDLSISRGLQEALMSCILCEACSASCPSGVRLDRVFENMRTELHERLGAAVPKKVLFTALTNPILLRLGARVVRMGMEVFPVPLGLKVGNIPFGRLPRFNATSFKSSVGRTIPARGKRKARMIYFTGCATDLVNEDVGRATLHVLTDLGIEVEVPPEQVCCSAPMFLAGARRQALSNIRTNLELLDRDDVDAVMVDCATCGAALRKSIPHLMEDLGEDTDKARRVAGKVKDISEIVAEHLEELELQGGGGKNKIRVTYHDPCHLVRSMKVSAAPRKVLTALPEVDLKEMAGSDQCCGGAGSFQFDYKEISAAVTARKKESIHATGAKIVATGCPGCRLTLSGNLCGAEDPVVLHTVQLVARALNTRPQGRNLQDPDA